MTESSIFFRADASFEIGYGHIYRCLALADSLLLSGRLCTFICREFEGNLINLIQSKGHKVEVIPILDYQNSNLWLGASWSEDADIVKGIIKGSAKFMVVDHYGIDYRWEGDFKDVVQEMIVIDDLADKKHDCKFLINQNIGWNKKDYKNLVSPQTELFIGPKYALLRPEFKKYRKYSIKRRDNPNLNNILISFGGVDKNNFSKKVLDHLKGINITNLSSIKVIIGKGNKHKNSLKKMCNDHITPIEILEDVNNMAEIMSQTDLIIGAAGSSSWERCSLGIPSIIFIMADNQKIGAHALAKEGCSILIKDNQTFKNSLNEALNYFLNTSNLKNSSNACKNMCDGDGVNTIIKSIF